MVENERKQQADSDFEKVQTELMQAQRISTEYYSKHKRWEDYSRAWKQWEGFHSPRGSHMCLPPVFTKGGTLKTHQTSLNESGPVTS